MGAGVTTGLLVVPRGGLLTGDLLLERGRIAPIIDNIMSDPKMIIRIFILYLVSFLHRINSLLLKNVYHRKPEMYSLLPVCDRSEIHNFPIELFKS